MTTSQIDLNPAELRSILTDAGIDITAPTWEGLLGSELDEIIFAGHTVSPHPDSGCLTIDGQPCYSAAWR